MRHNSLSRLRELGLGILVDWREAPTRRAMVLLDDAGERTIVTVGERLEPAGEKRSLRWDELGEMDGVYFTAGDIPALRAARAARVLVREPRAGHALGAGVELDALVLSGDDATERREAVSSPSKAKLLVFTEGERGGTYSSSDGTSGSWQGVTPDGERVDSYGCGDSFAAGLTYGLAAQLSLADALALGARCGAECSTRRGPYQPLRP